LLVDSEARLTGPAVGQVVARVVAEQDNIRAALRWLLDAGRLDDVGTIFPGLRRLWWARGQMAEGQRWAEEVLARQAPPLVRARAYLVAGIAAVLQGNEAAAGLFREARALAQAEGDPLVEGQSIEYEALQMSLRGDVAAGIAQLREGHEILVATGQDWIIGVSLANLSAMHVLNGELGEGDVARAVVLLRDAISLSQKVNQPELTAYALMGLAVVAGSDDPARATRLLGAAGALRQAAGALVWPERRKLYDGALEAVRAALGPRSFHAAWAEGRAMTRDQAVEYALGAHPHAS
jgi:hypothetical protein